MCTTCGCGNGETRIETAPLANEHGAHAPARDYGGDHPQAGDSVGGAQSRIEHDHVHRHDHRQVHHHEHRSGDGGAVGSHHPAHSHAPGMSQHRMIEIERGILERNDAYARANRRRFEERGIFALNLVSSPGAGKTTLLVETIRLLAGEPPVAVIEGDQQTSNDAERIRATGTRAIQINTGKGCHLDAAQVEHAADHLAPVRDSVLFIENVGNLVCPAAFDLGEAHKVVVLSVTEGEDKPLKYPDIFAGAAVMLLNKADLLPYVEFDVQRAVEAARRVNPSIAVLQLSATRGTGLDAWIGWLRDGARAARDHRLALDAAAAGRRRQLEANIAALR